MDWWFWLIMASLYQFGTLMLYGIGLWSWSGRYGVINGCFKIDLIANDIIVYQCAIASSVSLVCVFKYKYVL